MAMCLVGKNALFRLHQKSLVHAAIPEVNERPHDPYVVLLPPHLISACIFESPSSL